MGLLTGLTDAIGMTDTGSGAKAAERAGYISEQAKKASMGRLGGQQARAEEALHFGYTQSGGEFSRAASQAARQLREGGGRALSDLSFGAHQEGQFLGGGRDAALGRLDPLATAGLGALGNLERGATAEGFASNIEALRSGGALDPLIAENRRNLEAQLSAQGLGRSGYGITEMSQLPIETIMGIESGLQGRQAQVAGYGLPAVSSQAQLESIYGQQMADVYGGLGTDRANLEMALAQGQAGISSRLGEQRGGLMERGGANLSSLLSGFGKNLANIELGEGANQQAALLAAQQASAGERSGMSGLLGQGIGFLGSDTGGKMLSNIGGMF